MLNVQARQQQHSNATPADRDARALSSGAPPANAGMSWYGNAQHQCSSRAEYEGGPEGSHLGAGSSKMGLDFLVGGGERRDKDVYGFGNAATTSSRESSRGGSPVHPLSPMRNLRIGDILSVPQYAPGSRPGPAPTTRPAETARGGVTVNNDYESGSDAEQELGSGDDGAKREMRRMRNRESAQKSRQRRLQYMDDMEVKVSALTQENRDLRKRLDEVRRVRETQATFTTRVLQDKLERLQRTDVHPQETTYPLCPQLARLVGVSRVTGPQAAELLARFGAQLMGENPKRG